MTTAFQGYRSLIENSPDAISLINTQGNILYGSASTTKIFGYRPEELIGRNCLDLTHPEDRDHCSHALNNVVTRPSGPQQWDARVLHKDGNYSWVESTASNLLSENEVQAIVVHQRNINVRKAEEQERQRNLDELRRSNLRLEEFAYTAAHDLREPLRGIRLYSEMIGQKGDLDEQTRHLFGFIVDGAARMSRLVDDLLSFASTGVHEPSQPVDLQVALAQAMANLAPKIKSSCARIIVDRLPRAMGNEIHLIRLFQNLISNAIKYRSALQPVIHVKAERAHGDWIIRVDDNGLGIAPENRERVFMPFVRLASRAVPGTGLGLAVCKKIVEARGGKIWVEAAAGGGSSFRFTASAPDMSASAGTGN